MKDFGQTLRHLRGEMSLRALSRLANCGKSHICDLEHGRKQPSDAVAAALDDALGANGELSVLAAATRSMISASTSASPPTVVFDLPATRAKEGVTP
ncbi:helix-turn-helix transcriptional regulator [Streptomyces olivoreticuli]